MIVLGFDESIMQYLERKYPGIEADVVRVEHHMQHGELQVMVITVIVQKEKSGDGA
jgi:hypothetical protein